MSDPAASRRALPRYKMIENSRDDGAVGMQCDSNGPYVKYSDVSDLLTALEAREQEDDFLERFDKAVLTARAEAAEALWNEVGQHIDKAAIGHGHRQIKAVFELNLANKAERFALLVRAETAERQLQAAEGTVAAMKRQLESVEAFLDTVEWNEAGSENAAGDLQHAIQEALRAVPSPQEKP